MSELPFICSVMMLRKQDLSSYRQKQHQLQFNLYASMTIDKVMKVHQHFKRFQRCSIDSMNPSFLNNLRFFLSCFCFVCLFGWFISCSQFEKGPIAPVKSKRLKHSIAFTPDFILWSIILLIGICLMRLCKKQKVNSKQKQNKKIRCHVSCYIIFSFVRNLFFNID